MRFPIPTNLATDSPTSRFAAWRGAAMLTAAGSWYGWPLAALVMLVPQVLLADAKPVAGEGDAAQLQIDAAPARLIPVRLPLSGKDDQLYKGVIQRVADELGQAPVEGDRRPVLVLQLVADPKARQVDGRGSEFERSLALARFLASDRLAGVKTVAYLPRTVKGHAVLLAMACEEIAMAPDAEIGQAAIDEAPDLPIEPGMVSLYQQIADSRRTVPSAIAAGWVDRGAEVFRVESEDRIDLVLRDELQQLEANRTIVSQDLLVPAGALGLQSGRQGRELGFVKYLAADRDALARALGVASETLIEDQSLLAQWNPVVIDIEGPITGTTVDRIETLIGSELDSRGVNWIALRIDSSGGDLESSLRLATTVAELEQREVRTIAYVPVQARGGAAIVALACDQLVMHPGAVVGGGIVPPGAAGGDDPRVLDKPAAGEQDPAEQDAANQNANDQDDEQNGQPPEPDAPNPAREQIDSAVLSIQDSLAGKTQRTGSLLAAMIDPDMQVYRYTNRETAAVRLMSEAEAASLADGPNWRRGELVTKPGEVLELSAEQADRLGVAWQVVDTFDDLKRLYGFDDDPRLAKPNWAMELVRALAAPQLAMLLLMIAFVGIYVELNMPGVGFGGFIAAVAFMLFFWSKFTAQTADWLEVMLFITGVIFILLEILVLPGLGVFGFGGAVLVLASLVLASQTFILPQTETQLAELRGSLTTIAGSFVGFMLVGLVLRRYLPETPLFRRMQLAPPEGADRVERDQRETVADFSYLIGKTGLATTNLLPSGKAEFDGELVDVIADGDVIDRGAEVVVVSAQANRVLVRLVRRVS